MKIQSYVVFYLLNFDVFSKIFTSKWFFRAVLDRNHFFQLVIVYQNPKMQELSIGTRKKGEFWVCLYT